MQCDDFCGNVLLRLPLLQKKHRRRERKVLGHQLHELEHSPNSYTRAHRYYSRASERNFRAATVETIELRNVSAPASTSSLPSSPEEEDYQAFVPMFNPL
ncbi:hypothetical protein CEXT_392261 [Caerostris extrusa]|uniref:Uncharacterized protein n=1 Tax=Caerostris extrusa TaxID=172846 RepID=A0AAV4W8E3_CAEEX|nr:hypothetical protein CEXT_392261 [Caerostris extrusa]